MAKFFYRAKKGVHEIIEDVVEAANVNEAVLKVTQQGFLPIDLEVFEEKKRKAPRLIKSSSVLFSSRISKKQVVVFTRQLYDLIDAGIPLLRALRLLSDQDHHASMKKILEEMANFVQDGGSFSDGLARYPEVFSSLYVHLVKSGESSGQLSNVLGRLADFLEKDQEISSKATASLIYPGLILSVGVVTIFVLLSFVIPRLTEMFDELSQQLPWPTVFLMAVSTFFAKFWWAVLLFFGTGFFYFRQCEKDPKIRIKIDRLKLRVPMIGEFILKLEMVRFSQTLATLLEGGVSIVEALKGVSAVVVNHALRQELEKVAQEVAAGASLAESLKNVSFFSSAVVNMIIVGEESGHLEKALQKIAFSYERQTDQVIKTMTSLLEPILIVFIGAIIGFIVVAMLLPIFQMNLIIQ
jgi:type II secretory pathway component PulF